MKSLVCVTVNICAVLLALRAHAAQVVFETVTNLPGARLLQGVEEIRPNPGGMLLQGAAVRGNGFKDRSLSFVQQGRTSDGLLLTLAEEGVSVSIPEASFKSALGGFLVRDVASNSSFYGVDGWRCDPLDLQVKADYFPRPDHIEVRGQVIDFRNQDRAVTVVFALPIDAEGWMWGDDARRSRVIGAQTDYANLATVPCGATGSMSLYPLAAISGAYVGLAIAIDQRSSAVYRVGYHAQAKLLYIAYDFALVPDTKNFPRSAEFRFQLFRFEPAWGFREALRKYMHFSWMYKSTIPDQGIWMPFTDISTVEGWQDFGFKFKEGDNNVPWDDRHGVFTFRYTEPMTWWMPLEKGVPRTPESAVRVRDSMATGEGFAGQMARIAKLCAMHNEHGQPALLFRDTPWCDGAVWSINPNPHLFGGTNGGTIHWNKQVRQDYYPHQSGGRLDGAYLDSLEGNLTTELNYRREHFRDTSVPLTFDRRNNRPALFKGLATYEFVRWFTRDLTGSRIFLFANGVPYGFGFLCSWLDVLGTETDWLRDGRYTPTADSQMLYWRSLSGQKPYCLLMNTDFDVFTPEMVEFYFQRSLFYGMFPSMFSHNASGNAYWNNPNWYNRDRGLFKRYQPIIKRVAEAGWQPVTYATSSNPKILVERFGPGTKGTNYFTVLNDSPTAQTGSLCLGSVPLGIESQAATELLSGHTVALPSIEVPLAEIPLNLKPHQVLVYAIQVSPKPWSLNWLDLKYPYAPLGARIR